MTDATHKPASSPAEIQILELSDLTAALKAGFNDFRRAPMFGLVFSAFYVLGGLAIYLELSIRQETMWIIPIALGFPLLAPFAAVGLYEVSRRLEKDEPLDWASILGVVAQQRNRQLPSIAMVMIMIFMFWVFVAHLVFALFMGLQPMTNVMSSFEMLMTSNGLTMLAVGSVVGGALAFVLYSLTVISIPMLLDREMDFITAMINSFSLVTTNLVVMLVWAAIIAIMMLAGMAVFFVGLFVVLPILGHATWHLYRRGLAFED